MIIPHPRKTAWVPLHNLSQVSMLGMLVHLNLDQGPLSPSVSIICEAKRALKTAPICSTQFSL